MMRDRQAAARLPQGEFRPFAYTQGADLLAFLVLFHERLGPVCLVVGIHSPSSRRGGRCALNGAGAGGLARGQPQQLLLGRLSPAAGVAPLLDAPLGERGLHNTRQAITQHAPDLATCSTAAKSAVRRQCNCDILLHHATTGHPAEALSEG